MSNEAASRRAPERRVARKLGILSLPVLLLSAAVLVRADDTPIRFPDADSPSVTTDGNGERAGLRSLWFAWESQINEGNVEGATKSSDEILRMGKRLGVRRMTEDGPKIAWRQS